MKNIILFDTEVKEVKKDYEQTNMFPEICLIIFSEYCITRVVRSSIGY